MFRFALFRMKRFINLTVFVTTFGFASCTGEDFQSRCAALSSSLDLANTTVYFSQYVPGGTNISLSDTNVTCLTGPPTASVETNICRLSAFSATSDRSGINFEVWLPETWSGRFISHGNGGLSGCIDYNSLTYSSSYGFAAVSANSGHNGTSGGAFYKNIDVVADFVWRSLHTGVILGKEITKSFYGRPHTKSYYLGCSTGGRQGFKAVQDFPEDFDGVVAGAPAFAFENLTSESGYFYTVTGPPNSSTFVTPALWNVVHQDILKQCDNLDGYVDGILEDPLRCKYKPDDLACSSSIAIASSCLTPEQLLTVKKVFSPVVQTDDSIIYPRLQPGGEVGTPQLLLTGMIFPYTQDWFRYIIYNDPSWDPATLNKKDMGYASHLDPQHAQTWKGDLSAFRSRGAKVLHYHGQSDPLISSDNSPRYYEHVASTMRLEPDQLDDFYRFFRISGMGHCSGGIGAWGVGQTQAGAASKDPRANVLSAIVAWVEEGVAPETMLGTKYMNDTKSLGVAFQRKHCRYPYRNVYAGEGDPTKQENWHCVEAERYRTISALPICKLAGSC
jgi:feruloyl esterase